MASCLQGGLESFTLYYLDLARTQFDVVTNIAGAGNDPQLRKICADKVNQRETVFHIVDGVHQQPRLPGTGCGHQIEPGCITVEDLVTELAQHLYLIRIVIKDYCPNAVGKQQTANDLSETAETGN